MNKLIICSFLALSLVGCGKSQAEIEKEKQVQITAQKAKIEQEKKLKEQAEIKATEEVVKYYLKDGESARFRNVIKNCGEVNAKNSWGAYSGFSKFIVTPEKQVIFQDPENNYYESMAQIYCHKDYLAKFPVDNSSSAEATAASDAAPSIAVDEIPTRSRRVATGDELAEATAAAAAAAEEATAAASDAEPAT